MMTVTADNIGADRLTQPTIALIGKLCDLNQDRGTVGHMNDKFLTSTLGTTPAGIGGRLFLLAIMFKCFMASCFLFLVRSQRGDSVKKLKTLGKE